MIKLPDKHRQELGANRVRRLAHDLRMEGWTFEEVFAMSAGLLSAILSDITDPEDRVTLGQATIDILRKGGVDIDENGQAVFIARA